MQDKWNFEVWLFIFLSNLALLIMNSMAVEIWHFGPCQLYPVYFCKCLVGIFGKDKRYGTGALFVKDLTNFSGDAYE